jgi:hypothetical protein
LTDNEVNIVFDLLHCGGNIVAAALLLKPCLKVMKRLYQGGQQEAGHPV